MDAIFTHASSSHYNEVTGFRPFFIEFLSLVTEWHNSYGTCKHERFTGIPVIKITPSLRRRYTGTVTSDSHTPYNPVKDLPGG